MQRRCRTHSATMDGAASAAFGQVIDLCSSDEDSSVSPLPIGKPSESSSVETDVFVLPSQETSSVKSNLSSLSGRFLPPRSQLQPRQQAKELDKWLLDSPPLYTSPAP